MNSIFIEKFVTVRDGLKIYFRDYGNNKSKDIPIICLPGMTSNSKHFHNLAKNLAINRRIICPDLRGRGKSEYDKNKKNYWRPNIYTSDILSLMDSINIHSVFLIGTSLGGLLAMQLAVARPSVIKGIILNDIGPEFPIEGVNRISRLTGTNKFFKSWNDAALYLKETYTSAHPKISDEKWLELAKNTYTEKKGLIINNFDMNIISQMRYSSRSNNFWNLYDSIANIPTLLIRGSLSDILTKNITNKMLELKKDIKYLEVSLCGHCPFLDEKEVLQEIRNFLF